MRSYLSPASLLLVVFCLAGCSNRSKVYPVSGTVTYLGQPVPAGVIFFDPDGTKENLGPQGFAHIKDGHYNTADPGCKGVGGGPYVARIEGFDGKPARELPLGAPLLPRFQQPITMPQEPSTQNFDVPEQKR